MRKLLKLKHWLTVPDAARHLAILFGEEVTEADVLRLALDGHLTLSVDFVNHASARRGKIVPFDARRHLPGVQLPDEALAQLIEAMTEMGIGVGPGKILELEKDVVSISGIWDLTMLGSERLDVEQRYQMLTSGPSVELENFEGPLVSRGETLCRLLDHFEDNEFFDKKNVIKPHNHPDNYYPAARLPFGSVFVVRTAALQELEDRASELERPKEKPIERRERTTLLVIMAALTKLAKIDYTKPSAAAAAIENQTTLMGARVAARTVENHLKRIPGALADRAGD